MSICVGAHDVEQVTKFTYLGVSIESKLGPSSGETRRCIEIERSAFSQLEDLLWHRSITFASKIRLYLALIVPVLLYGYEVWSK